MVYIVWRYSLSNQGAPGGFGKGASFSRGDNKLGKASQDW